MSLNPGREMSLQRHVRESTVFDLSDLVGLPIETLETRQAESIEKEREIYQQLDDSTQAWVEQASETMRLKKAMQYIRTQPVTHTSNVWQAGSFGWHERSNMVYKMQWKTEEVKDRFTKEPIAWVVSWKVHYNTPRNPDFMGAGWEFAGQSDKRYANKADMEKYLQGRINAYDHLFTEISPPLPQDQYKRFCINGRLLPGYTVEQSMEPDKETVDALLSLLDDDDLLMEQPEAPAAEQEQAQPDQKPEPRFPARKHRPTQGKRNTAPVR